MLESRFKEEIIKEGIMEKKGEGKRHSWQMRWVVLTKRTVYFFKQAKDKTDLKNHVLLSEVPTSDARPD